MTIEHEAGKMVDGVQSCVRCGEIITDYRNTQTPGGGHGLQGFPMGIVYVSGNATTVTPPRDCKYEQCKKGLS